MGVFFLVHRYHVGFDFIPWRQILGTIPRGGARGQNLGHIHNMIDTILKFSFSLYLDIHKALSEIIHT